MRETEKRVTGKSDIGGGDHMGGESVARQREENEIMRKASCQRRA